MEKSKRSPQPSHRAGGVGKAVFLPVRSGGSAQLHITLYPHFCNGLPGSEPHRKNSTLRPEHQHRLTWSYLPTTCPAPSRA